MHRFFLSLFICTTLNFGLTAQAGGPNFASLEQPDSLYPARFWAASSTGAVVYGATMIGLNKAWYKDYPSGNFHFFNDNREWNQMDKMGHWLMSYQESRWIYGGARWTGMSPRTAAWVGFAGGQLIQTSFELYDGFSEQWGFSPGDVAFNLLGSGMFLSQQLGWGEQRILMKMSAMPVPYSEEPIYPVSGPAGAPPTTLRARADALYGTGPMNLFLKNYNTLAVWASVNPRSFLGKDARWCPPWLNIAVGMGADNLFAGFGYDWVADKNCVEPDCIHYAVSSEMYPRTRQLFLSLDVDYTRLRVKNKFLRALLSTANIIKFPAPTLEWRSGGNVRFHFVYF